MRAIPHATGTVPLPREVTGWSKAGEEGPKGQQWAVSQLPTLCRERQVLKLPLSLLKQLTLAF